MNATDLYELTDAAGWRMPIRVRWVNPANAEVTFAEIPMLEIQRKAMVEKLNASATHSKPYSKLTGLGDYPGMWWIPKLSLEKIADKAPDGTDPESLVVWKQPEPDLEADADFVRAFCKQRGVPELLKNPKTVEFILGALNEFMLKWLVAHGRSINFGWGRLDAFPVRANWKNAIIGRLFKPEGYRPRPEKSYRAHYTAGEYEFFRDNIVYQTELLTAYDKDTATMRWSVEFTPSKNFYEAAAERENKRKSSGRGKSNYLGAIILAIRESAILNRLHENLIAYSKETDLPFAIFPDGSGPCHPPKGWQPTRTTLEWHPVNLVTGASIEGTTGSALVTEDAGLHAVSNLRPGEKDVRLTGKDMDAAGQD